MNDPKPSHHAWAFGAGLAIAVAAATAAGARRVDALASRRWADLIARHQALAERLRSDPGTRDPLLGPALPGSAWEGYGLALARLRTLPEDDARVVELTVAGTSAPDEAARARQVVAAHGETLRLLCEASRRERAPCGMDLSGALPFDFRPARRAAFLVLLSSRERRAGGDHDGGLDDLAALLQMGADMGRVPTNPTFHFAVLVYLDEGVAALRDVVLDPRTPLAPIERIVSLTADLDRQFPSSVRVFEGEYSLLNERCIRLLGPAARAGLRKRLEIWRSGFSWRLHLAYLSENWGRVVEEARRRQPMGWGSLDSTPALPGGDPKFVSRSAVPIVVPDWQETERVARECLARLRLVRAVALERLGGGRGGPPWPMDPFTLGPLGRKVDGAATILWSAWTDGDDGGKGSWKPEGKGLDLVLELRP